MKVSRIRFAFSTTTKKILSDIFQSVHWRSVQKNTMVLQGESRFFASIALLLLVSITKSHTVDAFSVGNLKASQLPSGSSLILSQAASESAEIEASTAVETVSQAKERKIALLLCPAQFCVPDDYSELWDTLPSHIDVKQDGNAVTTKVSINKELSRVVPLSRRDWIKVSKQLPTQDFIDAKLRVHKTLDWYFDAIEEGLSAIVDAADEIDGICIVGHSIGGWVARAYLGGLAR